MMSMFYDSNLKFIAKRFPRLSEIIQKDNQEEAIDIEICRSKTGLPVARVSKNGRKVYLNSIYDPELEAVRWASKFTEENRDCCLMVCGAGFLYHLKEILTKNNFRKVVVYEPSLAVLKACLHEIDLEKTIENGDCFLIAGQNNLTEEIHIMQSYIGPFLTDYKIEILPVYTDLFKEELRVFQNKYQEFVRMFHINLATAESYGKNWLKSGIKALKYVIQSPGVRHFFNQFKGIPAICVAAGPSLEKNIHLLHDIKDKAIIICAGSSIRAMQKNKILPHFLLSFDEGAVNNEIYNDPGLKDVCLAYNHRLHHEVVEQYPGLKIHMQLDAEHFSDLITYKSGGYEYGTVMSGFSIAHTTLDFAFRLGCNPIVLIGQDLAYTGNKRYAEGQLESLQQQVDGFQLPPLGFVTKDIYGEDIVTDKIFESFRQLFEKRVTDIYQDKTKIINATEGGVPIQGIENRKLEEVIKEYCLADRRLKDKIASIYHSGRKELKKYGSQALCINWQIEQLMDKGIKKMKVLIDRVQGLRKQLNFSLESGDFQSFDQSLDQIIQEYIEALKYREYEILLKEFEATRIVLENEISEIGKTDNKEKYDRKLQGWLNIINETKLYLEYIRNANQDTKKTGEISNGN
jgi:hypothetical protein